MVLKWFGGATLALAAMTAAPAQAELVGAKDPTVIKQILEGQGLPTELKDGGESANYLESKHSGLKFLVLFMN